MSPTPRKKKPRNIANPANKKKKRDVPNPGKKKKECCQLHAHKTKKHNMLSTPREETENKKQKTRYVALANPITKTKKKTKPRCCQPQGETKTETNKTLEIRNNLGKKGDVANRTKNIYTPPPPPQTEALVVRVARPPLRRAPHPEQDVEGVPGVCRTLGVSFLNEPSEV